jgi:hypothetical protein
VSSPPPPNPYLPGDPYARSSVYDDRGSNKFAIASLVLGICGGFLLGVAFAIVAFRQIRRTREPGRGLALAGLLISIAWVAVGGLLVAVLIHSTAHRDQSGVITGAGRLAVRSLRVGDCADGVDPHAPVREIQAVPCSSPHHLEVFATLTYPEASWPGDGVVNTEADGRCRDAIFANPPSPSRVTGMHVLYLHPTAEAWATGDRFLKCLALSDDERTGSIYDGNTVVPRALRTGQCIAKLATGADIMIVTLTSCTESHQGEVYAKLTFPSGPYPGDKAIVSGSEHRCQSVLDRLAVPSARLSGAHVFWFRPTEVAWALGDHGLTCVLDTPGGHTGTIVGVDS